MSQARVHYVKHARQRYVKVPKLGDDGQQVLTPVTRKSGAPRLRKSGQQVVKRIRVADKEQPVPMPKCGKCGDTIEVGAPYRWFTVGFRGSAQFRCMKPGCTPRPSQLESSEHVGNVLSAMEDAEANINAIEADNAGDFTASFEDELTAIAEAADEGAQAYREADDAFGGTGDTQHAERAEAFETFSQEISGLQLSLDDPEGCGDEWAEAIENEDDKANAPTHGDPEPDCADCAAKVEEWLEAARSEAIDQLTSVDLDV